MKLNKYVVKATIQTLAFVASTTVASFVGIVALDYFSPTPAQVIGTLIVAFLMFCLYNMIKIQASILESRDKISQNLKK